MPGRGLDAGAGRLQTGDFAMDDQMVQAQQVANDGRWRARPRRLTTSAFVAVAMTALSCGGDADIERPTPLFTESPVEYPFELWDQDVEGSTLVRVLVNEEGGVDSAMVMESSGHSELDSAAVQGALSMEFDPATREGEPLRVWARVPVHFSKSRLQG